jgi:hypothetical protein
LGWGLSLYKTLEFGESERAVYSYSTLGMAV